MGPERWHDRAARAGFTPYEAVPTDGVRWAGGFGGGPDTTGHLEVLSIVDGRMVSVDTVVADDRTERYRMTMLAFDVVGHATIGDETITLPFSLTVLPDDREIVVDGVARPFDGARLDGDDRWVGSVGSATSGSASPPAVPTAPSFAESPTSSRSRTGRPTRPGGSATRDTRAVRRLAGRPAGRRH